MLKSCMIYYKSYPDFFTCISWISDIDCNYSG